MNLNEKENILKNAKRTLIKIYDSYKNKGLDSIYLWGSILGEDFDSEKSDIDSIALVNNKLSLHYEDKMINEIKILSPEIKDLKIRFIYFDELNNNLQKGNLTKHVSPRQILWDMKYWILICGKQYSADDFKLEPTLNEIISEERKTIKNEFKKIMSCEAKEGQYFGKAMLRLIYYTEQLNVQFPYPYSNLLKYAHSENKKIVKKLIKIKSEEWDLQQLKKQFKDLDEILNKIV